jgi:hypothetical protein
MKKSLLCVGLVLVMSSLVLADWDPLDGHKMHWPQMPDPNGWDICLNHQMIADDFQCGETGPITDVHFWVSWQDDNARWELVDSIGVNFYADGGNKPGELLKGYLIEPTDPEYSYRLAGSGNQGWHCPSAPYTEENDHQNFYQINLKPLDEPWFYQTQGQRYWLGINILMLPDETPLNPADDPQIGWKTALPSNHYGEFSKWKEGASPWLNVMPMDLVRDQAFVITPEPATLLLLTLGGLAAIRRKPS